MTDAQFQQFLHEQKLHIEAVIQTKVNGKVDRLINANQELSHRFDDYIKGDEEWKATAKPAIRLGTNMVGFGIVGGYIIGVLAALGACWGIIQWIAAVISQKS